MKKYLMIIAPLALAGCGPMQGSEIEEAKAILVENYFDPDAVKYRNEYVTDIKGGKMLCGEANGVNDTGNYIGYNRFMSVLGSKVVLNDADNSDADTDILADSTGNFPEGLDACQAAKWAKRIGAIGKSEVTKVCDRHKEIEAAKAARIAFDAKWNRVCRR